MQPARMLYAFVFSQEYGVAESGERYPVTFTTRYNDMMSTLFFQPGAGCCPRRNTSGMVRRVRA